MLGLPALRVDASPRQDDAVAQKWCHRVVPLIPWPCPWTTSATCFSVRETPDRTGVVRNLARMKGRSITAAMAIPLTGAMPPATLRDHETRRAPTADGDTA